MTTETAAVNYKIGNERLISVTAKAARKLASLLEEKGKSSGALRLAVVGGGCSGLQYVMDLVDGPKERDILVPTSNVRLVVDPETALFVSGSVLDYSEDLQKGGFKVTIPIAVSHCSCGERFAVCLFLRLFNFSFNRTLTGSQKAKRKEKLIPQPLPFSSWSSLPATQLARLRSKLWSSLKSRQCSSSQSSPWSSFPWTWPLFPLSSGFGNRGMRSTSVR